MCQRGSLLLCVHGEAFGGGLLELRGIEDSSARCGSAKARRRDGGPLHRYMEGAVPGWPLNRRGLRQCSLDGSSLPAGLYLVHLLVFVLLLVFVVLLL